MGTMIPLLLLVYFASIILFYLMLYLHNKHNTFFAPKNKHMKARAELISILPVLNTGMAFLMFFGIVAYAFYNDD